MSRDENAQLRRDTKKVFQIFLPQLPSQLIDMTTRLMFNAPQKEVVSLPKERRFIFKCAENCNGVLSLTSTKLDKNILHDMQFHLLDELHGMRKA